ncbi:cell envelope biogenesis protein TolA [Brevundimonas goettingensis]|uniref:Cell envelope biogenesis protein TolA n=1 Tax=Brevundimonas goettingensis TaxID=2774190 RepID=A0A975C1W0_9CAUL|nr:cell envelope biogenesis protein TolA [Brevundimonas goettingensis]QTC90285.1 cell envelope biogenesis protein TolA [Brevundimonas goettingensis]
MSKPPKRRLKVFQAPFGFYDTVVAAPSRAAALRAWGTHQDLFASGQAAEISDPETVAIAVRHPEVVLKRAVGSKDAFAVEATSLPDVPAPQPKAARAKPERAPVKAVKPAKPVDRRALDAAEALVRKVDQDRKAEEARFREREAALEAQRTAAQEAYVVERKAATAALVKAREAFRRAGGSD